jgi:GlcNAc-P-P-Und epimerase
MGKSNLIIGGSGFVGTRVLDIVNELDFFNLDKSDSVNYSHRTIIRDIRDEGLEKSFPENVDVVILLAAEHRDDTSPSSLYYDVNVQGTKNVLDAMDKKAITSIVFTSSVAIYGLNKNNPNEMHPADPFNHYGKSKWEAENVLRNWYSKKPMERSLTIIRPTVIFGEKNRGNVYNLLKQISSGKFLMIGNGRNKKSMAYVGNVAAFIKSRTLNSEPGYRVFNYIDKPDFNMKELVCQVEKSLDQRIPSFSFPYYLGLTGGYLFDLLSLVTGIKYPVSSVRVKKFCSTTQFDGAKAHDSGFIAPYSLVEGLDRTLKYEFLKKKA